MCTESRTRKPCKELMQGYKFQGVQKPDCPKPSPQKLYFSPSTIDLLAFFKI